MRKRVIHCRNKQLKRQDVPNHQLKGQQLHTVSSLGQKEMTFLQRAMEKFNLSARAYDRTLRVARTIADLDDSDTIHIVHLSEALSYRSSSN